MTAERRELLAVHGDAVALLEVEGDVLGLVRGVLGEDGEGVEVVAVLQVAGVEPRVLEDAGLVADVEEVAVHREGLLGAGLHGDALLSQ
jgi:hypothetical protein